MPPETRSGKTSEGRSCVFLQLPSSVRERIYIDAGLVRFCPVDVAEENRQHTNHKNALPQPHLYNIKCPYRLKRFALLFSWHNLGIQHGAHCICPPLPVQLLRVCRQVYKEAFSMLYSRNKFVLDPTAFSLLSRHAFSELRSLHVRLTSCSCVTGHLCHGIVDSTHNRMEGFPCTMCHLACRRGAGTALSVRQEADQVLFERWRSLCDILGSSCSLLSRLSVVGDCEDLQAACQVTNPLQGRLKLESCSIRLGQSPDDGLRQLAEATARSLSGSEVATTFPFEKLPEELQALVLAHTDLVSPLYLAWNERGRDDQPRKSLRQFQDHDKICCMRCTDAGEVCACPLSHAAHTTNACSCWRFPLSIFLVSRKVNELAKRVFFSKNKFILFDSTLPSYDGEHGTAENRAFDGYLADQTALLRSLPANSLTHLGWLRFSFTSFYCSDGLLGSAGHTAWAKLASTVKDVAQVSQLTIELDFVYNVGDVNLHPEMNETEQEEYWTSYQNIAELFSVTADDKTAPYRNFFVRLGSPQPVSFENDLVRWQRERELEKRIMGPAYDAAARGKYKRPMGYYEKVLLYQKPVYGPDGTLLNPLSERVRECYDPDESVGPQQFWCEHASS